MAAKILRAGRTGPAMPPDSDLQKAPQCYSDTMSGDSYYKVSRRFLLIGAAAALNASPVRLPGKVRLGMIGAEGHPGLILDVLPQLPDVQIVAISHENPSAADELIRSKPGLTGVHRYTDYRQMLDAERLDVVAVCNNNGERAAAIIACANHRVHVISEKPLAITGPDLELVRASVTRNGIKLGMLLDMRYEPPYLALREIVRSGEIGDAVQISSQKSYKLGNRPVWMRQSKTYGSTILWIGIHMIDLMRFTSGREFTHVSSFMGCVGSPELGDLQNTTVTGFRLDNGGTATLHMDYCRPDTATSHGDDRLRIAGTKGVAEYMAATGVTLMSAKSKPTVLSSLPQGGSVFVDFLNYVYNGQPATLPAEDIYRVCEVTLAANQAAYTGKVIPIA